MYSQLSNKKKEMFRLEIARFINTTRNRSERKMNKKKVKITNFYERNNDKVITNINLI